MNSLSFTISFVAVFLYAMLALVHAEEETSADNCSLYIESETKVVSPPCLIEGGNQDDDKKRTEVGIGEVITLKLPEREPSVFSILVPSGITAEHSGERIKDYPLDREKDRPGASSKLAVTFLPQTVSFSNISIMERAEDPEGFKPVHTPGELRMRPNAHNIHRHDSIGWRWDEKQAIRLKHLQSMNFPASFSWECGWYVRAGGKDCCKISNTTYSQKFSFEYDGIEADENASTKGLKNIKVTITKFGCTVTRSTAGDALHADSTTNK